MYWNTGERINFISIFNADFLNKHLTETYLRQPTCGAEFASTFSWTCWHADVVSQQDGIQHECYILHHYAKKIHKIKLF